MLAVEDETNSIEKHFQNLKKWQDEQMKHLKRTQEMHQAQLHAKTQRVEALLKDRFRLASEPSTSKSDNIININDMLVTGDSIAATTVESHHDRQISGKSKPGKSEHHMANNTGENAASRSKSNNCDEAPVSTLSVSFEDAIQQQMQKLQLQGKKDKVPEKAKPKRPFLKKGEGHQKYVPKPNFKKPAPQKSLLTRPLAKLNLKPKIKKTEPRPAIQRLQKEDDKFVSYFALPTNLQTKTTDVSNVPDKRNTSKYLNQEKKDQELKEFEILESAALNSSFCSDSSIVQAVFNKPHSDDKIASSSIPPTKTNQKTKHVPAMNAIELAQHMSGLDAMRRQLEKEIRRFNDPSVHSGDNTQRTVKHVVFETASSSSSSSVIGSDLNTSVVALCGPNPSLLNNRIHSAVNSVSNSEVEDNCIESDDGVSALRALLISKGKELEDEITIYKRNNALLEQLKIQRQEEIDDMKQKTRDIEVSKVEELKKLEAEIAEKRLEMKREKLTLERYRKQRKDQPSQKDKVEITELKHQVVTLQEDIKKQSMKHNCDRKRLRKLMESCEKEKDVLKEENEIFKSENSKLLDTIKKKDKALKDAKLNLQAHVIRLGTENQTSTDTSVKFNDATEDAAVVENTDASKPHVRFNLEPSVHYDTIEQSNCYEFVHANKIEKVYKSGEKEITYPSGTKALVSADGQHRKYLYYNGDVKEVFPDKKTVYTFADGTAETTLADGCQIFDYPSGQKEVIYSDGRVDTFLKDGTKVVQSSDGMHEILKTDGIRIKLIPNVMEVIEFPCGDKEIRTPDCIRHVYSDGTTKTVYRSGNVETVYSDGRLKVKNKEGKIIVNVK